MSNMYLEHVPSCLELSRVRLLTSYIRLYCSMFRTCLELMTHIVSCYIFCMTSYIRSIYRHCTIITTESILELMTCNFRGWFCTHTHTHTHTKKNVQITVKRLNCYSSTVICTSVYTVWLATYEVCVSQVLDLSSIIITQCKFHSMFRLFYLILF